MTGVFSHPAFDDHERVLHWSDRATGLRAIVAIHRVRNGRAAGGCRARDFTSEDSTPCAATAEAVLAEAARQGIPSGEAAESLAMEMATR